MIFINNELSDERQIVVYSKLIRCCEVTITFSPSLVQLLECNHVTQAVNLLQGLIPGEDAPKQADAAYLEKLFVFSLMWSIGASLELADRKKVDNLLELNAIRSTFFTNECVDISSTKAWLLRACI